MNQVASGFRSLTLLFNLNWDRILYVATVFAALFAGAFFGSLSL